MKATPAKSGPAPAKSDAALFDEFLGTARVIRMCPKLTSVSSDPRFGIKPSTFLGAGGERKKSDYNMDPDGSYCIIDSVGAQANRLEEIFLEPRYRGLVPHIVVNIPTPTRVLRVDMIEAGHRAADAGFGYSTLHDELQKAWTALSQKNAVPLVKLSPLSATGGVWNSRGTREQLTRVLRSRIYAFDVKKQFESAHFEPAAQFFDEGVFAKPDKKGGMEDERGEDGLAPGRLGLTSVPAPLKPGGIKVMGEIRREVVLDLEVVRRLYGPDEKSTLLLRRYILGLALVMFTSDRGEGLLREGCHLMRDGVAKTEVVFKDGRIEELKLTHEEAEAYATVAAADFGVGKDMECDFDKKAASKDIEESKPKEVKAAAKKKKYDRAVAKADAADDDSGDAEGGTEGDE